MNEKALIFIFTTNREKYWYFANGCAYHTYEKIIHDLTDFTFEKFQLKHNWEKECIQSWFYDKLEVLYNCYISKNGFSCISSDSMNCNNIIDAYNVEGDFLNCIAIIYKQKYDGTFQVLIFNKRNRLCELNVLFDNKYSYTFEKYNCFDKYFKVNEQCLDKINEAKDGLEVEKILSEAFDLPLTDELYNGLVKSAKKHEDFGVGGKYDPPGDDEEDDEESDERVRRVLDWLDTVSPDAIEFTDGGFVLNKDVTDSASIHILTKDIDEIKKCVIDISSEPIMPNPEQMDYYEQKNLERVFSVLGNDFCDKLKEGTELSRRLQRRNLYCIENQHGYSLFSDSFFFDTIECQVDEYFSCGYMPYVITFEYDGESEMALRLYQNGVLSGEIVVFSAECLQRNIWKNAELICSLLNCDLSAMKKSVDKKNLLKTVNKWTFITGLPLNVSFDKISQNREFYDAQEWFGKN